MNTPLPGLGAPYVHLCLTRVGPGAWELHVQPCDGPGFVSASEGDRYEWLSPEEALDVTSAAVSTLLGTPWR